MLRRPCRPHGAAAPCAGRLGVTAPGSAPHKKLTLAAEFEARPVSHHVVVPVMGACGPANRPTSPQGRCPSCPRSYWSPPDRYPASSSPDVAAPRGTLAREPLYGEADILRAVPNEFSPTCPSTSSRVSTSAQSLSTGTFTSVPPGAPVGARRRSRGRSPRHTWEGRMPSGRSNTSGPA